MNRKARRWELYARVGRRRRCVSEVDCRCERLHKMHAVGLRWSPGRDKRRHVQLKYYEMRPNQGIGGINTGGVAGGDRMARGPKRPDARLRR